MMKYVSIEAKCPYYNREDTVSVYCEGLVKGGSTRIMLGCEKRASEHKNKFCNSIENYGSCPYARAMNRIYGEED